MGAAVRYCYWDASEKGFWVLLNKGADRTISLSVLGLHYLEVFVWVDVDVCASLACCIQVK